MISTQTTKRNGPRYWKAKADESAAEGLSRMKALEAELVKKRKLRSVTLPDGCVITATEERLAYLLEEHNPRPVKQANTTPDIGDKLKTCRKRKSKPKEE